VKACALGEGVEPRNDDERNVREFLDGLHGELLDEEDAYLPMEVGGERVTISGIVDLVHVTADTVEIVDYKTDRCRHAEDEYRKQLSVYYRVAEAVCPDREISASIFYTESGNRRSVEPLTVSELETLVEEIGNR